jgi:hypothetical protein
MRLMVLIAANARTIVRIAYEGYVIPAKCVTLRGGENNLTACDSSKIRQNTRRDVEQLACPMESKGSLGKCAPIRCHTVSDFPCVI